MSTERVERIDRFIGKRIRQSLNARKVTQTALSEYTGITIDRLNAMTKGKSKPRASDIFLICKALDVSPLSILPDLEGDY